MIKLKPVFSEKIWGGNKLASEFGYNIPSNKTGEAWLIGAHKNGDCEIVEGEFAGITLSELYSSRRDLFGNIKSEVYPLLVKLLDASDNLSVQVHPDDEYAKKDNDLGKNECWYVVDAEENADIIIGHNASTKDELVDMIDSGKWDQLLNIRKANKGDFFNIPSGMLHAICSGTMIYELQQSSDTTYRLYDYDRLQNGEPRELHLKDSKNVIGVPQNVAISNNIKIDDNTTKLVENSFFRLYEIEIDGNYSYDISEFPFTQISVLDGEGKINNVDVKKGENLIAFSNENKLEFEGQMQIFISTI